MELERIQEVLREEQLDGWLFYDFRQSNPIAYQVLGLPLDAMYTRRWFYLVPAQGEPVALTSSVEAHVLHTLPGSHLVFRTWRELHTHLQHMLQAGMQIAMEYSPMNAIPYMSRVDAGTIELVRSCGAEVVSSANLAQYFVAQLSLEQQESHREAGRRLMMAKDRLLSELGADLLHENELNEYQVQKRFSVLIEQTGLDLPEPPIVAVNANASNPHYLPTSTSYSPLRRGDLILLDFWAKLPQPNAVYADYTWMVFAGTDDEIPPRQQAIFELVRQARDSGIAFAREQLQAGKTVEGRQVDDATRHVIEQGGYSDYFVHRTGHSITTFEHGNGANVDNFETQDDRLLLPYTCCSIEPGIYLPDFGVRSEVNLLIGEHSLEVTGVPAQQKIIALLA